MLYSVQVLVFIKTASITLFKFIYVLDDFEGEFEEDLEALLGSMFMGVASILPVEYDKVQKVKNLEGDCADSTVGDECMFWAKIFTRSGVRGPR